MGAVCGCSRATGISPKHNSWPQMSRKTRIVGYEVPAIAHDQVPSEVAEASSRDNNKRVEEARRARVVWLERLRRESASDEEFETARSQPIWTQLDSTSCSSSCALYGASPAALQRIQEENRLHFQHLVNTQPDDLYCYLRRLPFQELNNLDSLPFFSDFEGRLEAGQKIGGGGQADIHKAICNGKALDWCVLKVFRSDCLLRDLQRTWTTGITKVSFRESMHCCGIRCGTLLQDGRFAFVFPRCWGDLRKAIDLGIVKDKTHHNPPFPLSTTLRIMMDIASGMMVLHCRGILHRDLKAANCLLIFNPNDIRFKGNDYLVADFESSKGVLGTRFWRAPEVLLALKNKERDINSTQEIWTKMADVYSYAMTCYEVLTGCIPFEDCAANDYDGVIGGERPPLPDYVDPKLQKLVRRCWHSQPSMRPTFEEILGEIQTTHYKNY